MHPPLQALIHTAGLTRVRSEIEQVALPSVRLRAHTLDDAQLQPGITRFGGLPDVPRGWMWPTYNGCALPFVGQINLAEVASYMGRYWHNLLLDSQTGCTPARFQPGTTHIAMFLRMEWTTERYRY